VVAPGEILEQDPEADETLRQGRAVEVVLSQGPVPVAVPAVAGQPAEQALAALRAAPYELDVTRRDVPDAEVPAGLVVGTDPAAGVSVVQGGAVVLEVSAGPAPVDVPDVVGLPRDQAVAVLEAAGLVVSVTESYRDDEQRLGRVAAQSRRPGAAAERGDAVALVVSLGPATVRVPDVRGQTIETAVDRLETAGFEVVVVEERRPRLGPISMGRLGYVEEQDPGPLGELPRGGEITLTTYTE
jgi:serine/threonine-protein kinase